MGPAFDMRGSGLPGRVLSVERSGLCVRISASYKSQREAVETLASNRLYCGC